MAGGFKDKKFGVVIELPVGEGYGILRGNDGRMYEFRFTKVQSDPGKLIGGHVSGFGNMFRVGDAVEFRVDKRSGVRILRRHRVGMN